MKKIFYTLCMLTLFDNAHAQTANSWHQVFSPGSTPSSRRDAVSFSIGTKGYVGPGSHGIDFWEYNPSTNRWTQKVDFGGGVSESASGFSIGSNGYIGVGLQNGNLSKDFWEYDPSKNLWARKADFGGSGRVNAVSFSIGTEGYIGTGLSNGNYLKDFWEYNSRTNAWTQKADFGGEARFLAVAFSIDNKGYIGSGSNDNGYKNDFWEYDTLANAWTRKADFAGDARGGAVAFSIGSKGYFGTGYNGDNSTFYKDFWEYDPSNNAWIQKADFGGTARGFASGVSIDGKGYIGFGDAGKGGVLENDWWQYTPDETLPLHIISFTAEYSGKSNVLYWITSKEMNSDHFDIERSNDGSSFSRIGTVKTTGGDLQNSYSYTDINLVKPVNYYRLKIMDKDASFSYSKTIKVGHNTEFNINITPNPATAGFINLALSSVNTSTVIISITNMNGKIVYTHQFTSTSDYLTETINVNGLGKGMYVLKAVNGNTSKTMKFMKE